VKQRIFAVALGIALCAPGGALTYEIGFPYRDDLLIMHVNLLGSFPIYVPWNAVVADAASQWSSSEDVRVDLRYQFSDPCAGLLPETINDPKNGMAFRADVCGIAFDDDTLAVTLLSYELGSDAVIVEGDIIFNRIELAIEEPVDGSTTAGVSNIRGWAIGDSNIMSVGLYIDGDYIADIPHGGTREDVGNAFPTHPSSIESGYSMAVAWGLFSPGQHDIRIRATDFLGRSAEASGTFTVASFDNAFISDPAKVSVSGTVEKLDARTIRLNGVQADGALYDVKLQWQPASQKFEMVEIKPAS
jgi:hypothetical protein